MVSAVREMMEEEEGIGVGKMVKRIRAERLELAGVVNSKAVKQAKVAVEAEMAAGGGEEGGGEAGGDGGWVGGCYVLGVADAAG